MTRDDIIRMAGVANLWLTSDERIAAVERFAALVAAAEREACLKIIRETPFSNWYAGDVDHAIRARGES